MKSDFELVVHKLPEDLPYINIYPLGDLHIGSPQFNEDMWRKWKEIVLADEYGYVVLVGDLMNNALKTSKSNCYEEVMRPREQKEWLVRELRPLADKILGGVRGNHCERSVIAGDDCPMYDVMAKLDLEDYYRENMCFLKVNLGKKSNGKQASYTIVLGHGASDNKTKQFMYTIDNMDIFITGHTHSPLNRFPSKIVIDSQNEIVRMADFTHIVVPSFQDYGGYAIRGMYQPQSSSKFPIVTLYGSKKGVAITWK